MAGWSTVIPHRNKYVRYGRNEVGDSCLICLQGNFEIQLRPTVADKGDNVGVPHDLSRVSFEPIDDLEPLLVPRVLQHFLDQTLEFVFFRELPEELSFRIVANRAEETADDGLDVRLCVVEMSPHAHDDRLPSTQPLVQFRVCDLDGGCVQDDWAVETEEVRHDQRKFNLADTGTDDMGCTSNSFVHPR